MVGKKKFNIVVFGMASSGKTSLIKRLAIEFKLKPVFTSKVLRKIGKFDVSKEGFWESKKGRDYLKKRKQDFSFDIALDRELIKLALKGGRVFDSWTLAWLLPKGLSFNIFLEVSTKERARRLTGRNDIDLKTAMQRIKFRDNHNKKLFKKLYGIEIGKDLKPFHAIINSEKLSQEQTFEKAKKAVKKFLKSKRS